MQTDNDNTIELPDSGRIVNELTEEEIEVYRSTAKTLFEGKVALWADSERGGEGNLQSPEVAETMASVQRAQILFDLIEETAIWRKCGLPSSVSQESTESSGFTPESDRNAEARDE